MSVGEDLLINSWLTIALTIMHTNEGIQEAGICVKPNVSVNGTCVDSHWCLVLNYSSNILIFYPYRTVPAMFVEYGARYDLGTSLFPPSKHTDFLKPRFLRLMICTSREQISEGQCPARKCQLVFFCRIYTLSYDGSSDAYKQKVMSYLYQWYLIGCRSQASFRAGRPFQYEPIQYWIYKQWSCCHELQVKEPIESKKNPI